MHGCFLKGSATDRGHWSLALVPCGVLVWRSRQSCDLAECVTVMLPLVFLADWHEFSLDGRDGSPWV